MFPFLAPAALKLLFGKALGNAAGDVKAAGRWLGTLNIYQIGCIVLAVLLVVQHVGRVVDHRHSAKLQVQLAGATKLYHDTKAAFDRTVANYRAAAAQAAADDKANADRVRAEQARINQEASDEYEARIAAARAAADRLRQQLAAGAAANSSGRPGTPVPAVPAAGGAAQAAGEDGFSVADRLIATEQAIQLDELIKAARKVMAIDPNGPVAPSAQKGPRKP